jgi:hypothetical protein
LSTTPILTYPKWKIEFHVHIDASVIALGAIMAQPWEGNLDHLVYFANRNLSQAQCNYPTTEMEGLTMVSSLQKFRHYLLDTC